VAAAAADGVVRSEGKRPADASRPAFDQLTNAESVLKFFRREFPDAVSLMPTLVEDFFENPTGELGTLKCWPWNVGGKAVLLGDSAHAVVPFYGQGMNCAFEDVRVLDSLIETNGADWETIYSEYGELRKVNTDAIADMAEENFYEMRDKVAQPIFQRKREVETRLEQTFPDYFSKYSMVTFREDLPYSVAKEIGTKQDNLLMWICQRVVDTSKLDLDLVMRQIRQIK
jgi:kynurenine 3-monooxygenase